MKATYICSVMLLVGNLVNAQYRAEKTVSKDIRSGILNEEREVTVMLPMGYASSGLSYPVVYLLDGEQLLPALETVHSFYSGGFMPDMILVGIDNSSHRVRDLTPTEVTTLWGMPYDGKSGGADEFLSFIEEELVPMIDQEFRTTDFRTLVGHSYGGLFTVHALLHGSSFRQYLAIDPSLDWDEQQMLNSLPNMLKDFEHRSLFVTMSGQLHNQDPSITIENVMNDASPQTLFARSIKGFIEHAEQVETLETGWRYYPDDLHGTVVLPSLMDGLIALFEWFQMENVHLFNNFETPTPKLEELIHHRATKLEKHFGYQAAPYPEEMLNVMGYMSMDMEQPEKAKMFFQSAVTYYPESANAYDSFAEYCEQQGDLKNALELISKAAQLSDDTYYQERLKEITAKSNGR